MIEGTYTRQIKNKLFTVKIRNITTFSADLNFPTWPDTRWDKIPLARVKDILKDFKLIKNELVLFI